MSNKNTDTWTLCLNGCSWWRPSAIHFSGFDRSYFVVNQWLNTGWTQMQCSVVDSHCVCTDRPNKLQHSHVCPVCEKGFATRKYLEHHIAAHSGENVVYRCRYCEKSYTFPSYLRKHMNIHREKYKCEECGKCCQDKFDLTSHARMMHSTDKPFLCTVCGRGFAVKSFLTRHSRKHSAERPFKCDVCTKGFKKPGSLHVHLKTRLHAREQLFELSSINWL